MKLFFIANMEIQQKMEEEISNYVYVYFEFEFFPIWISPRSQNKSAGISKKFSIVLYPMS